MPPEVVAQMEQFRLQLDAHDQAQGARMAAAWGNATRGLEGEYERVAQEIADRQARGLPVSRWYIQRMERYQSLMAQIAAKQRELAPIMVDEIESAQATLARLGLEHSQAALDFISPGIVGQFDRLPYSAVANMVGNTGAGGPLGRLLRESWGQNAGAVGDALVRGTALGWHPTKTASAMRQAAAMNLQRAILISRTEGLRVYRQVSLEAYRASGIVTSWLRIAAHSARTCIACLALDRREYRLNESFDAHPACRCTLVPVTRTSPPLRSEDGRQWFERQDATTQRAMMGPQRFNLWRSGRASFDDMVRMHKDSTWGDSPQVVPLRELAA